MDDDRKKPFRSDAKRSGSRSFGDKKPFGERKSFGDKKPFGEKKAFGDKKPFGDRKPREDAPRRREPEIVEDPTNGERIAKRLARAGISSRRDAEALIADGRIKVNGVVLDSPARNVTANDRIELDGRAIPEIERTRLFLFHKPGGVVTTNKDPEGRRTVFDVLPSDLPRLLTVGRLDINTEGLLLLTNDGGLSRVLELPATGWLRRYRVRVHGEVDENKLAELKNGIAVDGVFYGSIEATLDRQQGSNAWLTLALREGKNREVKNVLGALGLEVTRLIRISYGPFQLGDMPEGSVHELKGRYLRDQLGDRLIAESGAVFDLPVREAPKPREENSDQSDRREGTPNRRREREEHRSEMLDRLQTKPRGGFGDKPRAGGFGDKPRGKFGDKPAGRGGDKAERSDKFEPAAPRRNANVWMAPGARPRNQKKVEAEAAERAAREEARGPRTRSFSDRPRRDDARGEGRGEARSFRPRGDRPEGDRPFRPRGDRPEGDRPFRPRGDRPEGDKPFRSRPSEGRSGEDRPFVKRERSDERGDFRSDGPRRERPAGAKPYAPKRDGEKRPFSKERPASGDRPQGRSFKPKDDTRPRGEGGDRGPRKDGPQRGGFKGGRNADRRR